jgi:hypothetical protein
VVVWDVGVDMKLYLDGVLEGTTASADPYTDNNATPFNLGAGQRNTFQFRCWH